MQRYKDLLLKVMVVLMLACTSSNDVYSQGLWEKVKSKASEAWNSDTRKEAWEKTKEKTKEAYSKAKDTYHKAKESETWQKTKQKTKEYYSKAKEKTKEAYEEAKESDTWTMTKSKANEVIAKIKDSKIYQDTGGKATSMLDSKRYTVPVTGRKFLNFVPDSYMLSMANSQYKQYMRSARKSSDTNKTAQVKRVAQRLANAVKKFYRDNGMSSELKNFNWEFNLVKNSEANAWCMPGGKIVVYEGILPITQNDASLAVVLGHEIAHAIAKHSSEQMSKKIMEACGVAVCYAIISGSDMSTKKKYLLAAMTSAGVTLANLKFSRIDETEADRLGLIIAAMAGYNPEAAVGFWQRMAEHSNSSTTHDWYSDHPSDANRISNVKSFLPEAKKYYKKR